MESAVDSIWGALVLATLAGASIPLGAWLGTFHRHIMPDWLEDEARHGVVAFGAGALLAAVALVLIPEGSERLAPAPALLWFFAGGVGFALIDRILGKTGGRLSQFLAMMMDYLPEALALGALIVGDPGAAVLVAGLIALQNLPEGFNAMREMSQDRPVPLWIFFVMVPLGPLAAFIGVTLPAEQDALIGAVMMLASGGILYLMLQDIAPQVRLDNAMLPPLCGVLGFGLGLAGDLFI
ncbi:hypothetical protein CEP88_17995 [Roseobacter denitrificans]|uniref:Divalent cation transporter n=1 Tax=Roseobacter denitrificans (strain ATCC 33942 / OCh 114) TaxID=375451 RepID=Q169T5_ROSDO|nr:hypothetical protein [Roseobacter denitrificans]ABG31258.1 hypothetical protein RD1_1631 [Roseobacter denitrificans OCh 114]AVL54306.1 hypothetical protein CEP88_17995 [Roseobacter denitrificans]SFF98636.1 zinc transporter, ZIP family [Roseobacter denitrificans OCh 114]